MFAKRNLLIHHPPCLRGFFAALASGAVDGQGAALAFGFRDDDDDDDDDAIVPSTASIAFAGAGPAA